MLGIAVRKLVTLPGSTLGIVCDLLEKLSDPEWVEATKKFLRKENPWKMRLFEVWRTLTIGGVSRDELMARLGNGFFVSDWAKDIMSKPEFTTLPESTEIQLARATVKDLGFAEPPTTTELFARIKEVGDLCPAEVGPHLRLTDTDQPNSSRYWVAMEPITGSGGSPSVFHVRRRGDGVRWLAAICAGPGYRWDLGNAVVFRLRK
ncbi:MAG: hypothetical protein HY452_02295, partial [Parcubacteria group bacterium]|nr:hypothetical protein [Parcubacteria group bacterium]